MDVFLTVVGIELWADLIGSVSYLAVNADAAS